MRSAFNRLSIGISSSGVAVMRVQGIFRRTVSLAGQMPLGRADTSLATSIGDTLGGLLDLHAPRRAIARIAVCDSLCRLFLVTPPQNATHVGDCKAAAERRFNSLYGDTLSNWTLDADWKLGHPFLACAIPAELRVAIVESMTSRNQTVTLLAPHYVVAWNRWRKRLPEDGWFATLSDGMLSISAIEKKRLTFIRQLRFDGRHPDVDSNLRAVVESEALKAHLPCPAGILVSGCQHHEPETPISGKSWVQALTPPAPGAATGLASDELNLALMVQT